MEVVVGEGGRGELLIAGGGEGMGVMSGGVVVGGGGLGGAKGGLSTGHGVGLER